MPIDIAKRVVKDSSKLNAWVEFKDGISIQIQYVSREQLQKLYKQTSFWKFNPQTKTRENVVDPTRFVDAFSSLSVVGWKGVTPRTFSAAFVPLDMNDLTDEQKDEEIPFDLETFKVAVTNSWELDKFIQDLAVDPKIFSPDQEEELKNSEPSQSGS